MASFRQDAAALHRGEVTCAELVERYLERVRTANDGINAFLSVDAAGARKRAAWLDSTDDALTLKGMVVGVKDNIAVRGQRLTCGSRMLESFTSMFTATAVERLEAAGAIVIGKLNCDEFAMGSSNETSFFGPVRNPLDESRVPGGSSGGSAAAVAAGMCHAALGSDTGGSVRLPAAFCGVVGLKPTYGRVSRYGLVAHASSLDCVGPITSSVADAAAILHVIAGVDPNDATSASVAVPEVAGDPLSPDLPGLRIGLPREYFGEGLDAGVRAVVDQSLEKLRSAGAEIRDVSLPHTRYGVATYYVIATAEASSNLARYDGVRYGHRAELAEVTRTLAEEREALELALVAAEQDGDDERLSAAQQLIDRHDTPLARLYGQTRTEGFGTEVKRRIMLGTYVLSSGYYDAYYGTAQRVRALIRQDFEQAFQQVDVLLTPAAPTPPFRIGEKAEDPLSMYLSDVYTVTANLAGVPGLVVPASRSHESGMPVGIQLLGRHFDEATLLRVGAMLHH